jgi:phosphoribulokinase
MIACRSQQRHGSACLLLVLLRASQTAAFRQRVGDRGASKEEAAQSFAPLPNTAGVGAAKQRFPAGNPYLRNLLGPPLRMGAANSVPTGLVWPSPEAAEKLREAEGIKMYPTHAWTDNMMPILSAENVMDKNPVMIGVAADSGCGKSTFLKRIMGALGTEVTPGHTAIGDMMTVVCLDDYHINDRAGRKATGLTALDATENDFALMGAQMEALRQRKAVYKPIYNHDTGFKDPPELIQPNQLMIFEGLHPIYDEVASKALDLGIYIDIVNDVKFAWKVQRDVEERGWTEEQVKADIEKRLPDFSEYVDPQKANADVVLRYEPSDKGLPFLKVKLIQKKGGAFPMVTLKKSMSLKGSESGAELKMYDDDWFGNKVTVLEMDGEIDMGNFAKQLSEIESNLEGLAKKNPSEFTDAMKKLESNPGSQNGTGVFQTVIAMKVREVYEKLTSQAAQKKPTKDSAEKEAQKEALRKVLMGMEIKPQAVAR